MRTSLLSCSLSIPSTATARYRPTCDALDLVVANARSMDCTRNDECDTVNCTVTQERFDGISLTLTILPCRDPPGVHVVVREPDSDIILDDVYDHTVTGIDLGSPATLDVTVDQLNITLIGLKVGKIYIMRTCAYNSLLMFVHLVV